MEITIGWPQGIIILLWLAGLIIHGLKHGENKTGKYNIWARTCYRGMKLMAQG